MRSGVLVDTGPLVATANDGDPYHAICIAEASRIRAPLYTCWPVIAEAAYLLKNRPRNVQTLLRWIGTSTLRLLPLEDADSEGIAEILRRYVDQRFDLADAALMHLAWREGIESVFTIDHRHFSLYRTPNGKPLLLRPAKG